jgi:hypothetical protein
MIDGVVGAVVLYGTGLALRVPGTRHVTSGGQSVAGWALGGLIISHASI